MKQMNVMQDKESTAESASILAPIMTPTACLMGIATCMSVEEIKTASVMEDKEIYCGECEKFLYEDTDGFGICGKTKEVCYCGDKCHLTHGKP